MKVLSFGGHTQMKVHVPIDAFCSVTASSREAMRICVHRANVSDWLVARGWSRSGRADEEIIHCGKVAEQDRSTGGAQGVRQEEGSPFLWLHWSGKEACSEQTSAVKNKRPGFPCTVSLPFPQLTRRCGLQPKPWGITLDSLYSSVTFVFQVYRVRCSSLCVKQWNGTMLPVCTWRFRSASVLYNQICIST